MQSFLSTFQKYINPEDSIVLAISGGVDSMVLLDLVSGHHPRENIIVAHFDHMLRGDQSDLDRELVANICNSKNIRFEVRRMDIGLLTHVSKMSIEESARFHRYGFLNEIREKYSAKYILTAHHRDDRIETAVFHLVRGTKLQGIHALKIVSGDVFRPLLNLTKNEILEYAHEHSIIYREDHTNQEDIYTRNHIRHNIIPEFTRINPVYQRSMSDFIDYTEEVQEYINSQIRTWIDSYSLDKKHENALYEIDRDALSRESRFFQKECVRYWYEVCNQGTL